MAPTNLLPFEGIMPQLGRDVFVAPNASVIGQVVLGDEASVWFGSVLRGDVGTITVGARTNVQDLCVLHMSLGISNVVLGDDVTVGHGVIVHGATIGHRCLIGMGSILLDNVEVGEDCMIAAGSLVPPRMVIPARSLAVGRPAKVIRTVTEAELQTSRDIAERYLGMAAKYR